ncbi:MAG: rRNA pseudouridine synthase [Clostridiales Family XIII bacterium]|jgi:23S rRNA pseudouridine2605 synthase|nr:rRNA pseudouridine synthase [Clostridiales Family XIII bacterium]
MRLNKYIAQTGVASRRKADEMVFAGRVRVNGAAVDSPGLDVTDGDVVSVDGRDIRPQTRLIYIALNKPKGYITTTDDDRSRPTVMELASDIEERIYPVGRLDADTTGLLLMTNDGQLAHKLTHPKSEMVKTYRARVTGVISNERLGRLRRGVDIGGYRTAPAEAELIRQGKTSALVEIRIHEGKNRQIRKMFAAVGNKVLDLERTAVGDIRLGNLKQGHYRKLKQNEIDLLRKH